MANIGTGERTYVLFGANIITALRGTANLANMPHGADGRLPPASAKPRTIAIILVALRTFLVVRPVSGNWIRTIGKDRSMIAVREVIVSNIKQYAQALKNQLGVSLAKAQAITATSHGFADWHELNTVASRNPFDDRLRAAACSSRSFPGIRTPPAIDIALRAGDRLSLATGLPIADARAINVLARGCLGTETLSPFYHFDFEANSITSESPEPCQFKINLFDPKPRLTVIAGMAGWGKSCLGRAIALAHAKHAGNVCLLDPYIDVFGGMSNDWSTKLARQMLSVGKSSRHHTDAKCHLAPFTQPISFIDCDARGSGVPPLDILLGEIRERLLPFSVLLIDEPQAFSLHAGMSRVSEEIGKILAGGTAVIWLSQEIPFQTLPVNDEQHSWDVLFLLGRSNYRHAANEKLLKLAEISRHLTMERDEYTSWIASWTTHGAPSGAAIVKTPIGRYGAEK